jgi:hypothetical protein
VYCHSLSVSVAVVLTLVFAIGLAKTTLADWIHDERLLLALFYLFWAGCIITVYCYWYGLPSLSQSPPVTQCMHTTCTGNVVTRTSLFHIYYSCADSVFGLCTHNLTTYLVCSHGNQHICFNPTLEIQGILVSSTQVFNPDKPVSLLFDACAAIDQDGCKGKGCDCGGLTWERAYTSNGKYMCRRDNSWPCDDVGSYYCHY